ncbi:MAG: rRNA maturation protein [Archaeoglobaceae archaeon]
MIITTSRKPSRKTRRFVKAISKFLGWKYVQRGKMSLKNLSLDRICIVTEIKGNPGVMNFYENGEKVLEIFFSVSNIKKNFNGEIMKDVLYIGNKYNFFNTISKDLLEKFDKRPFFEKRIVEKGKELLFYFKDDLLFKIRIHKVRKIHQNP